MLLKDIFHKLNGLLTRFHGLAGIDRILTRVTGGLGNKDRRKQGKVRKGSVALRF